MEIVLSAPTAAPGRPGRAMIPVMPEARVSDGELLERVAGGDAGAFEVLYRRYARAMFGLALRRLGDRSRAEEAVQETFAAIWRSAASYDSERGPGAPWLYAVARHAIVDRSRARVEATADAPDHPTAEPGPQERAEASFVAWRLHSALEELPERERTVLELAYWGGLSQSEVAEFLNMPLGTVKTRTRSALSRLADLVDEDLR